MLREFGHIVQKKNTNRRALLFLPSLSSSSVSLGREEGSNLLHARRREEERKKEELTDFCWEGGGVAAYNIVPSLSLPRCFHVVSGIGKGEEGEGGMVVEHAT